MRAATATQIIEVSHSQGCPVGCMYLVVHNRSAVGFVVLHFVTIILDLNVEHVFLCTCALRANFGRFVTADYFFRPNIFRDKKNIPASSFSFQRARMGPRVGNLSPSKCTVTVCLQNQNPNSAVEAAAGATAAGQRRMGPAAGSRGGGMRVS